MKVQLAGKWTDAKGVVHEGDEIVDVDPALARSLVYNGQARPVSVPPKKRTASRAAKKIKE